MGSKADEAVLIKKYLLGKTTEQETQAVEERLMVDAVFFSQIIVEEEGLVEDYVQGRMSSDAEKEFEESFMSTPAGRKQVQLTKELVQYASRDQPRIVTPIAGAAKTRRLTASPSNWLKIAASILIIVGLALGIYRSFFYLSDADKGMAELRRAFQDRRPTEARLSGFAYAPWSLQRGDSRADTVYAERLLLDAVHDDPGPKSHHALGVFYLTQRQFDKAIQEFELSAKDSPPEARLQSDWGTALFERGRERQGSTSGRSVEDFAKSLEHLQNALELDPSRLDPLFNLALLYEAQGLPERAIESWNEYLSKDQTSNWANEAREHLQRLQNRQRSSLANQEQLVSKFVDAYETRDEDLAWRLLRDSKATAVGKSIGDQLLDSYLDHSLRGETNEGRYIFNILSYAGHLEYKWASEGYTQTLTKFYETQHPANLNLLRQARNLIQQGHGHYTQNQNALAIDAYTGAKSIFERLKNKAEATASDYWIAYCYTDVFDSQASHIRLQKVLKLSDENRFRWLHARSLSVQAANYYVQSKYSEAAKCFQASLEEAEAIGDTIGTLNCLDTLTELYRTIGNHARSFEYIELGFAPALACTLNPNQRLRHYSIASSALAAADYWEAALAYQEEGLKGDLTGAQTNAAVAYAHLSALYARKKRYDNANESIQLAYQYLEQIEKGRQRESLSAYLQLFLAHISRELLDYETAITTYTNTIEMFSRLGIPVISYQAYKGRLYCHLASQNDRLIEEDLAATMMLLEADRSNILESDDRNHFFDMEQSVYDIAISHAHSKFEDKSRAFAYSESSRARSLFDLMKGAGASAGGLNTASLSLKEAFPSLTLEALRPRFPEGGQIVQYAVLDDRTVIWIVSRDDFSSVVSEVTREKLDADIKSYLALIARPNNGQTEDELRLSEKLYNILIKPVVDSMDAAKTIYIVPDKLLSYLPFEALRNPGSQRYLLQDFNIAYTPSSSIFIACSEEARDKEGSGPEHLLSVGDPAFNREDFPGLERLRSAKREAEGIAEFYRDPVVLTTDDAQEQRIKAEIGKSTVIHIAAHALPDEFAPLQSRFLLAKALGQSPLHADVDGVLEALEIYKTRMPRTRLAVLSACQSGAGRYYNGEGVLSLARPFIAAGVPLVVASLWEVDSDATADLMIDFHKYRRQEKCPSVQALRKSRLNMLNHGPIRFRHPYYWAPFIAVGGWTRY